MTAARPLPLSLRAQRVLLWVVAALLLLNVVSSLVATGADPFALGYSLPYVLLSVLCAVLALRLPRGERRVRLAISAVHVLLLLGELGRLADGDLRAVIGATIPIVGLVLLFRPRARRFFSA